MVNNNPADPSPLELWVAFRDAMSEDYVRIDNDNQVDAHSRALDVRKKKKLSSQLVFFYK